MSKQNELNLKFNILSEILSYGLLLEKTRDGYFTTLEKYFNLSPGSLASFVQTGAGYTIEQLTTMANVLIATIATEQKLARKEKDEQEKEEENPERSKLLRGTKDLTPYDLHKLREII